MSMNYMIFGAAMLVAAATIWFTGIADDVPPFKQVGQAATAALYPVSEWDHGLETSRVRATRYESKSFGYNIGFDFPKDINNADRAEVGDFMDVHGGWLFQGGGYPGATAYVKFKDVTDKESANAKLREILPSLSQLMADMSIGKNVVIAKPRPDYEWPDTAPPDKSDPSWEFNNNLNANGTPYKKEEVSPGKWQWVIDQESAKRMREYERQKADLYSAMRTRVLTDEEFERAKSYDLSLVTRNMEPFYENEKRRELDDAFAQQARLRAIAATK